MKFRRDFVTNSSSTSYTCDVCGREESGWDMSIEDAEMYECKMGHTFCETHAIGEVNLEDEDGYDDRYNIPIENCPICQLRVLTDENALVYLMKELGKTKKLLLKEVKEKFGDYETFSNYLGIKL